MTKTNNNFDWRSINKKLQREKKSGLIQLIRELAAVSPETIRFLQTRYQHKKNISARIKSYQQQIDAQFEGDYAPLDLSQVRQAVQNYQRATDNEEKGMAELWIYAFEVAAGFMRGMGMHDLSYQNELAELGWEYVDFMGDHPHLYSLYAKRMFIVCGWLNESGADWISESFYQLEADMDALSEDI